MSKSLEDLNIAYPVRTEDGKMLITDMLPFEGCNERLAFHTRDIHGNDHWIGLATILSLVRIAEREQAIPALPDDWCNTIAGLYS